MSLVVSWEIRAGLNSPGLMEKESISDVSVVNFEEGVFVNSVEQVKFLLGQVLKQKRPSFSCAVANTAP